MPGEPKAILLTGYPSHAIARRLLEKVLAENAAARLICATAAPLVPAAQVHLETLPESSRRRVEIRYDDVTAMDFGLSGKQFYQLAERVEIIHHCGATVRSGMDAVTAERVNVRATGEVLEVAKAAKGLKQLVFWSTALISGSRRGVVTEDELVRPPRFRSAAEQTIFRAEKLLRDAAAEVPLTVLRPSQIIGSEINADGDPIEEPHLFIQLILSAPRDRPILLPKRGELFFHVVPLDFAVEAGWAICSNPRSIGKTFHLVDPNPLKVRQVVDLVAKTNGRPLEIGELPSALTTTLLHAPGLKRWFEIPLTLLEQLAADVVYDARNASEILQNSDKSCPSLPAYLSRVIERAKRAM